jgi:hypothetical protein
MAKTVLAAALAVVMAGTVWAGAAGGPGSEDGEVAAKEFKAYQVEFKGKVPATVKVESKGIADLFLLVYRNGKLVTSGKAQAGAKVATFTPDNAGTYRLVVKNVGAKAVKYRISHD